MVKYFFIKVLSSTEIKAELNIIYIGGLHTFTYNCENVVVRALKILSVLEDQNPLQQKKSSKKSQKYY